jgi:peptidyl-tRNA hydrolase, PTH1 family
MGLFLRKLTADTRPKYTLSMQSTKLVVGLGNPGTEYDNTRHNVGFLVVDKLVEQNSATWRVQKDLKCQISDFRIGPDRVLVIKPTTFMNLSGIAVLAVQNFYKITNENTLVIHDELDIDFGKIRSGAGGGAAGHNGIKSIIALCEQSFNRLRLGVGPKVHPDQDSADFVLGKFSTEQKTQLKAITKEALIMLQEWLPLNRAIDSETRIV